MRFDVLTCGDVPNFFLKSDVPTFWRRAADVPTFWGWAERLRPLISFCSDVALESPSPPRAIHMATPPKKTEKKK